MKKLLFVLLSAILMIIWSCASAPLPPPEWTFEKDAIKLHIKADPKLNADEDEAHTLLLCVYQLQDPNAFNQLSGDEDGLYKLLDCGLFGAGAASAKRLIVQPSQVVDVVMDRAEGARYVAVVAGYYILDKERMVKMLEIPVALDKKGFIKKTITQKPQAMDIEIALGPQQITSVERK